MHLLAFRRGTHSAYASACHIAVRVHTAHTGLYRDAVSVTVGNIEERERAQALVVGIADVAYELIGTRTLVLRLRKRFGKMLAPPFAVRTGK